MPDEPQPEPEKNAVVIERAITEEGRVDYRIGVSGDVQVTEIGDMLASALAIHRSRLGV